MLKKFRFSEDDHNTSVLCFHGSLHALSLVTHHTIRNTTVNHRTGSIYPMFFLHLAVSQPPRHCSGRPCPSHLAHPAIATPSNHCPTHLEIHVVIHLEPRCVLSKLTTYNRWPMVADILSMASCGN